MKRPDETPGPAAAGPVQFPPTLWTMVLEAKQADPERAQKALGELCVHYREAILGYFRLKCRHHHDTEDLTSAFVAHLLARRRLGSFDRESCPQFRAYLSVSLKNFFGDWLDKRNAVKRGDGSPDESLEDLREAGIDLAAADAQLERAVDLGIARLVHQRVMATLETKAADPRRFAVLRDFVPFEHGSESYEQAAKSLGLSPEAVRKAVFDLRKSYVRCFRVEVAPTVRNVRREVDDETSNLLELLPEAVALESGQHSSS